MKVGYTSKDKPGRMIHLKQTNRHYIQVEELGDDPANIFRNLQELEFYLGTKIMQVTYNANEVQKPEETREVSDSGETRRLAETA